ncbi:sperm receptor for egg jelly-like [Branchiostoma floridae]|uniref:Sperm receptor for egg jelly-like n=1 Tax=Branchiostoma floridae TaxID=7739 RepID=A0A9J7LIA6_BRAFL|nr:sperm receptor for egg jelly-like [Branchiostoma floridae]
MSRYNLDECTKNNAACPQGSNCIDTPGGYGCTYCSPDVNILGGGTSIARSRGITLTSRLNVSANCVDKRVEYIWEFFPPSGTRWQVLADVVSTKADLLVAPRTLQYGLYLFRLSVLVTETTTGAVVSGISHNTSVSITPSPLIAGILGGARRQVGVGKFTIDAATLSSDPDGIISRSADLDYRWSCDPINGDCPALHGGTDGLLTVNTNRGSLNSELTFTVEVSAPNRGSASASQVIEVVPSTIPQSSIICDTTYGTCGPKINSGERLRLSALCSNCRADPNNYRYNWTLVQTQGVATTWTDEDWKANILNDRSQDYVTFRAEIFDPQVQYTVTSTVTDSNTGESGSAEYSFTVNQPPTVGTCEIHELGNAAGFFQIQCQGNENIL